MPALDPASRIGTLKRIARSRVAPPSLRSTAPARIAIVEPNRAKAELLYYFCTNFWGFEVVALERTGRKGISAARRTNPELVLAAATPIDLTLPAFAVGFRKAAVGCRILLLASQFNECFLHTLSSAEYHGLVYEPDENLHSLAHAIQQVRSGFRFTSKRIAAAQEALRASPQAFHKLLTDRETQVLSCIAHSLSDDEIAPRLGCSPATILTHRRELMRKLEIHSTPKLIRYCIEKGFVSLATSPR